MGRGLRGSAEAMMEMCARVGLCLLLGKGLLSSALEVRGMLGGAVTLPCAYFVEEYGKTSMCWGRGCDTFTCSNAIISTDGSRVTWRRSARYQLPGDIEDGDVSLTITDLTMEDQGMYCCRVEITGPGNDQKHIMTLTVYEAPEITKPAPTTRSHNTMYEASAPTDEIKNSADSSTNTPSSETETDFRKFQETDLTTTEAPTSHSTIIITVVVLVILFLCLLGFLSAWKYYKVRSKNKEGNTALEDLKEKQDAEQNIYI
ncbi:hepatitis A virus cellular receptor 1 homolog isoform X2 [Hyperolius riggenbachi]|uniref:hepatitis A virus cellular receptor 1 homolog isoform X2 n=1 Tax=Hyperolius riggenbachi TaxID=752182 RepID=UPI0035A30895